MINPLLATGQIQGGVAQGVGQALIEDIVYDRDSGQLVTGSLMDYGIPRADMLPAIGAGFSPVPSTTNPTVIASKAKQSGSNEPRPIELLRPPLRVPEKRPSGDPRNDVAAIWPNTVRGHQSRFLIRRYLTGTALV